MSFHKKISALALTGSLLLAAPALAVDWVKVPGLEMTLFLPGQSSWEWALTAENMSGAADFRKGKDCAVCHIGEEKDMGPQIAAGTPRQFKTGEKPSIEPEPIAGKPGALQAMVKVAREGANLLVHVDFAQGQQPDVHQDPNAASTLTVMFNNGKVPEANRGGCWAACHDDLTGMPSAQGATRTMYLPKSRAKLSRQGGGDTLAASDQLDALHSSGYQLEYWQALLNPGQPAKTATQIVFDKRAPASRNVVTADATQTGDKWSVTLTRPIAAGAPFTDLAADTPYYLAFALHTGHSAHRGHYVSFERVLQLTADAATLSNPKQ
jgi:cytochrome c-type protein NapC